MFLQPVLAVGAACPGIGALLPLLRLSDLQCAFFHLSVYTNVMSSGGVCADARACWLGAPGTCVCSKSCAALCSTELGLHTKHCAVLRASVGRAVVAQELLAAPVSI